MSNGQETLEDAQRDLGYHAHYAGVYAKAARMSEGFEMLEFVRQADFHRRQADACRIRIAQLVKGGTRGDNRAERSIF